MQRARNHGFISGKQDVSDSEDSREALSLSTVRGGFSDLGAPGNIGMGPYTFAHIYLDQPWGSFFVVMLAAAQWCPIVVSNVSTFFMYML